MAIIHRIGFQLGAPDFNGTTIPGGARYWEGDWETYKQDHFGWGVLAQIGQEYPIVNDDTPPWMTEAATKIASLGINWIGMPFTPGFTHSDFDSYGAWRDVGFPNTGTERDNMFNRRHWPINTANYYFSQFDWYAPFLAAAKTAIEAAGMPFRYYIKVSNYDQSIANTVGGYILANFADRYGTIIRKLWDHIDANWAAQIGMPTAIDTMNETAFDNSYDQALTKLRDSWIQARTQLQAGSYALPQFWGPSYQDCDFLTASNLDTLWNADTGSFRSYMEFTSHTYGGPTSDGSWTGIANGFSNYGTVVAARTGSWIDTENPSKPLKNSLAITHGRCAGNMNFACAIGSSSTNDLLMYTAANPVGSQITEQDRTKFMKRFMETFRDGDRYIAVNRFNLTDDTDEANCVMARDQLGRVKGLVTTNKANAVYVKVPAGRYRVKKTVGNYPGGPWGTAGSASITSMDDVGVTYDVTTGQGIHLNGQNSNAAGVYTFVQES
jgi:hypothetical protein